MKTQRKEKTFFSSSSSSEWTKLEKEVAEIMIHDLCRFSLLSSIPYSWGRKRKRSQIKNNPSPSPSPVNNHRAVNARAALPPVKVEADVNAGVTLLPVKDEPSSHVTQSNRKKKYSNKRVSLKKKTESALQTTQELTETKDSLTEAIEKVKQHYANLKNYNSNLKKRQQELLRRELKNPNSENRMKVQLGQSNSSVNTSKSNIEFEEYKRKQHQQVQIQIQMQMFANHQKKNYGPSFSNIALEHNINRDNDGLIILPDLNLIAEESIHVASFQRLDETTTNRAIAAAQARQRRLEIFRHKKSFVNNSKQH